MAPAAAVVGVLGGVGLAALLARPRAHGRVLPALVAVALVPALLGLPGRVAELPHAWHSSARIDDSHARLRALVREIGRDRCCAAAVWRRATCSCAPALAWELDVPLADVVSFGRPSRRSGAFVVGLQASPGLREDMRAARHPAREPRRVERLLGRLPADGEFVIGGAQRRGLGRDAVGLDRARVSSWYSPSALTAHRSCAGARATFSTARRAVSIEWSELL